MNNKDIVLSIILISHNQVNLIKRCIESIIAQPIPFPYEIVIGDDNSIDGTRDIINTYVSQYPISKAKNGLYTPRIIASWCDSDDYDPANKSQRGGWNRSCAFKYVHGKYLAHVDADDYYRPGAHNFADQVSLLESHPQCSMCVENIYYLKEGEPFENATLLWPQEELRQGRIITQKEYIMHPYFMHTVAFLLRLDDSDLSKYGGRYEDVVLTAHFLPRGDIVCYNSADYVYVQYASSTCHTMMQSKDLFVLWGLGIYLPALVPSTSHWYFLAKIDEIQSIVSACKRRYQLEPSSKKMLQGMNVYVYDAFNREHTIFDRLRLHGSTWYIRQMKRFHLTNRIFTTILYKLIIR